MYMWSATHILQNISCKVMYVELIVFIIKLYVNIRICRIVFCNASVKSVLSQQFY